MANTIVTIVSTGAEYTLPGTQWTVESVVSNFADSVPGIGSMQSEVTTAENGDKLISFRPRTGTKGAGNTVVTIVSTGAEYTLPGTQWTVESVVSNFADSVPGIGSMQSEVTMDGENKLISFRPRTGTKG